MLIEQPPLLYRLLFPEAIWRIQGRRKRRVFLTFDDGPIPECTPMILDILDRYGVKATFFMVGDNVRRYPHLFEEIKRRGHSYGNHTMHHVQGMKVTWPTYIRDIYRADRYIDSHLFRPPHGIMRWKQARIVKRRFNIVMYDVVTRDYDPTLPSSRVLKNVMRYTRNGSIIVFHDSLKSLGHIPEVLPAAIEWLQRKGYEICPVPMHP
ncbi:MAG: polysaccharide deacetylase family protein [Muribaculaceae bacterium]|nr:polysaccharide deacetylase family protein [Muribaculaceae bacterium]